MEESEEMDPRVQIELDRLNTASNEINRLESELDEANSLFRHTLTTSASVLRLLAGRLGGTTVVDRARPYYEARRQAQRLQLDCHRAAVQFQRASVLHQTARETIQLAEQRFLLAPPVARADATDSARHSGGATTVAAATYSVSGTACNAATEAEVGDNVSAGGGESDSGASAGGGERGGAFEFDNAWQEMLNHATMKLLEAEQLKNSSERLHQARAATFAAFQSTLLKLEKSQRRAIARSRGYFERREAVQNELARQKDSVVLLQRRVAAAKHNYAASLRQLEHISEDIHHRRQLRGVRAEHDSSPVLSEVTGPDDTGDLVSELDQQSSATSDYAEDFRLSQEQQYWSDMREQIEAIGTTVGAGGGGGSLPTLISAMLTKQSPEDGATDATETHVHLTTTTSSSSDTTTTAVSSSSTTTTSSSDTGDCKVKEEVEGAGAEAQQKEVMAAIADHVCCVSDEFIHQQQQQQQQQHEQQQLQQQCQRRSLSDNKCDVSDTGETTTTTDDVINHDADADDGVPLTGQLSEAVADGE